MTDQSDYRCQSRFGPTLESDRLPELGADRARRRLSARGKVWLAIGIALALFWGGVGWIVVGGIS